MWPISCFIILVVLVPLMVWVLKINPDASNGSHKTNFYSSFIANHFTTFLSVSLFFYLISAVHWQIRRTWRGFITEFGLFGICRVFSTTYQSLVSTIHKFFIVINSIIWTIVLSSDNLFEDIFQCELGVFASPLTFNLLYKWVSTLQPLVSHSKFFV